MHARITLSVAVVLVLVLASPVWCQQPTPPGTLEPGTYNAPAGAGAYPPALPSSPPSYTPLSPLPGMSRDILNHDILNPGQWNWQSRTQAYFRPGQDEQDTAHIKIIVPSSDAQLRVNGVPTRQRGRERVFVSPPLLPGRYQYRFQASWVADQTRISATKMVRFYPGADLVIDFTPGVQSR